MIPRRWVLRALFLLAVTIASVVGIELAYRRLAPADAAERAALTNLRRMVAGESGRYEARPHTSYGLTPRAGNTNSLGFHGPEWSLEPAPGVTRILCLGGSTTEGGNDDGTAGSYPFLLEDGLQKRLLRDFEVMNCGVSAWTTAETLVSWFLLLQDYEPDFVIMHHVINDVMPRNAVGFVPDYRHWRTAWREPRFGVVEGLLIRSSDAFARWRLKKPDDAIGLSTRGRRTNVFAETGALPPETARAYRRNLISIGRSVEERGGRYCLMTMPARPPALADAMYYGLAEHNRIMREVALEHGWTLIDVEEAFPGYPGYSAEAFFLDMVHLTSAGNRAKATIAGVALLPYL